MKVLELFAGTRSILGFLEELKQQRTMMDGGADHAAD